MRVYYYNAEYETGKHKIFTVWAEYLGIGMPDEYITTSYSVLEFDEFYNRNLAKLIFLYKRVDEGLPDSFYVDNSGELRDELSSLVSINANPQKESYKLSALYGLTQEQLATYIDSNVTDLASARAFLKKLSAVVLWLVKQARLDE